METKMLMDLCTVLEQFGGVVRHANFQSIDGCRGYLDCKFSVRGNYFAFHYMYNKFEEERITLSLFSNFLVNEVWEQFKVS